MYDSLKEWMNVPVTIKPFVKRTGTGSKEFGEPIEALCYPLGEVKAITNNAGAEVVSNNQLYFDGKVSITDKDAVIFEGKERDIQAISTFYRNGSPDIRVVYL